MTSFLEKVSISFVVISILTTMIVLMFLDRNKVLTDIFNIECQMLFINNSQKQLSEMFFHIDGTHPITHVTEGFQEGLNIGQKMKDAFRKGGSIEKGIKGPLEKFKDVFENIKRAFEIIPQRFKHLNRAFKKVGDGIKLQFVNLGKSLKLGFNDIFDLFGTLGKCGIKYVNNLRSCIIWYILDGIGSTLYSIFVKLPVFMIRILTGFNMQPFVDGINCMVKYIDSLYFKLTCYHFIHFPDWVIQDCYTCNFQQKVDKINKDWLRTIPKLLNQPRRKFLQSEAHFKEFIAPIKGRKGGRRKKRR